ncbi:hypothetical protein N656DRAFT_7038 [Canariomyces notabilis]|uniref:Uncharacterized protein n=1 Tax=Canariomyces notabilis TaxID=2074819 RepID=A0AAN6TM99_9PEZI|nr:hypothetical protein N656DRAFT_7038 [Canariomyces arenarius]
MWLSAFGGFGDRIQQLSRSGPVGAERSMPRLCNLKDHDAEPIAVERNCTASMPCSWNCTTGIGWLFSWAAFLGLTRRKTKENAEPALA